MTQNTEPIFPTHMHPPCSPSASPFSLAEDSSLSPTFCSSLDPCSSHGFSSLQSPSAFPSFFSNDSSQQIEAFQPLSLDSSELCGCHHCYGKAVLDITQDGSASHSNLNALSSEGPLLHHADSQKHVCPFLHSSPKKIPSRNCEALQIDQGFNCIPTGSPLQENATAELFISLPLSPSSPWEDTDSSALLPIHDGCNEKEQPVFSEFDPLLLSSSPDPRERSDLLRKNNSNDGGYASHVQFDKIWQFESFKTDSQTNDTACIDAHTPEVVSSVLTSLSHSFPGLSTRHGDADDKEKFVDHINSSRERRMELLDNLTPPCRVESKLNRKREGKKEVLQEAHENKKKTMYFPCKEEMCIDVNAVDEASKENRSPHIFEQVHKRVGGLKADCNGWMCPKDAKKNFKPKPRQLLLDKWLTRQR